MYTSDLVWLENNTNGYDQLYHVHNLDLNKASDKAENSFANSGGCIDNDKQDSQDNNNTEQDSDCKVDLSNAHTPRTPTKLQYKLVYSKRDEKRINKLN